MYLLFVMVHEDAVLVSAVDARHGWDNVVMASRLMGFEGIFKGHSYIVYNVLCTMQSCMSARGRIHECCAVEVRTTGTISPPSQLVTIENYCVPTCVGTPYYNYPVDSCKPRFPIQAPHQASAMESSYAMATALFRLIHPQTPAAITAGHLSTSDDKG